MTDETEETFTDLDEAPAKRTRRGVPGKPRASRKKPPRAHIQLSAALQSDLRKLQHAAARGSSASAAEWARVSRAADKALALLLPDKGPRSMEISTVYMCQKVDDQRSHKYKHQDTENEYEIENADNTRQCDETEQWLIEDYFRQRCEVKARRGAKMCCKFLLLWDEKTGELGMMCHLSCERTLRESTEISDMHLLISWKNSSEMQTCQIRQLRL